MEQLVRIEYKNAEMKTVTTETYTLQAYVGQMRQDIQRVISDVEALIYHLTGLPRVEWDVETWKAFSQIRHKLLDKAGEISRLPEHMKEALANKDGA